MPTVEDLLGDLPGHPPSEPRPPSEVRRRARHRTHRRRSVAGAVVVVAVGIAAGIVGPWSPVDDPGQDVFVDGGPSSTALPATDPPSSTTPDGVPSESLTLDPATGLVDGTEVSVHLDEPVVTGEVIIAQCSAEAAEVRPGDTSDPLRWCSGMTQVGALELPAATFEVRRVLDTVDGPVDCAQPERCILAVRVGGPASTDDRYAVLRFAPDLPVVVEAAVTVAGVARPVADGTALALMFSGVATGESISVAQCIPGPTEALEFCSAARGLATAVQDGPDTNLSFTAFHDIAVDDAAEPGYAPAWRRCEPCALVVWVGERRAPIATVALTMEPTDAPIRPAVEITALDPGPVSGGTVVAVRATGLQPRTEVGVGWCPSARLVGGGDPPCVGSTSPEVAPVAVAADGTLSVPTFTIPLDAARSLFGDCTQEGACGVGLDAGDAFSVLALAPVVVSD